MGEIGAKIDANKDERKAGLKPPTFAPAGQSTQMIVGATATPDAAILDTATSLYKKHRLRRVYYSAFSPIPHADDRLPPDKPPLIREHRLYQADWLMRFYGFELRELTTPAQPNLDLEIDPKLAWALTHRERFPVNVNRAPREQLLRIPGVGVRTVNRIIQTRRYRALTASDLQKLRVPWRRVRYFVETTDHTPYLRDLDSDQLRNRFLPGPMTRQLNLFDAANTAHSGEL
jgi:predicted DNA-binding helix-hairpin-helix protein